MAEAEEEAQTGRHKAETGMEKREGALGAEELKQEKISDSRSHSVGEGDPKM